MPRKRKYKRPPILNKGQPLARLSSQTSIIRRGYVRRVLIEAWDNGQAFQSIKDIRLYLMQHYSIDASIQTITNDLSAVGAIKATPEGHGKTFWMLPAYDPESEPVRAKIDQITVTNELAHRIHSYVLEMFVHQSTVVIKTDMFCGKMIAHWIAMLTWPEILHIASYDHSIMVLCISEDMAETVRRRLIGEVPGAPIEKAPYGTG